MIKNKTTTLILLFTFICIISTSLFAQTKILFGIRFMGLAFHPKKSKHPYLYKTKLDNNGHFVLTKGIVLMADLQIYKELNFHLAQALIAHDCARQKAGMSQIGLSYIYALPWNDKQAINICIGPMLFYRKNWNLLPGYIDEKLFKQTNNGKAQLKFVWYGIYGDYLFNLNEKHSLSISILPGIPELIAVAPGLTYIYKTNKITIKN